MNCGRCSAETQVLDSRKNELNIVRRRRECVACGHRVTTYESTVSPAVIIKHRQSNAARGRRYWANLSSEQRKALKQREHRRAEARIEASTTGKPVAEIYALWGVT